MNRIEFMKELEYLLQDIADEDKADALDYYRDYLEEAGDENEQDVLKEFGSPERIAAMIRSDLCGGMESAGEFTDSGFQDSRFEDPRYQLAKRMDLPEAQDEYIKSGRGSAGKQRDNGTSGKRSWGKVILIVILLCFASPFLLGFGGALIGVLAAVVSVLITMAILVAVLTIVFFIAAVCLIVFGIVHLFVVPAEGLLSCGVGIGFLGLAFLSLAVSILFYGKLVPAIVRGGVNLISGIVHKKGGNMYEKGN